MDEPTTVAAETAGAAGVGVLLWVERAATGIELLAVAIIVTVIVVATAAYLVRIVSRRAGPDTYRDYRHQVARALLLGLEILVAADVIRTVALDPSLRNVLILGLLVIIRTFLSWTLVLEMEERWPWQPKPGRAEDAETDRQPASTR